VHSFFLRTILSLGIFFICGGLAEAKELIRVLIVRDVSQCKISGQELALRDLTTGRALFKKTKISSLTIQREKGRRLRVLGQPIAAQAFSLTSPRGPLAINGRQYRDKLKIFPGQNGGIWVINELPLEEYLVGVVHCEISSQWPWEAVKAQAVVARTYATFQGENRAAELYDLDSGVSDQVYEGIGKEDLQSRKAVEETKGELVLYHGRPIFAVYHSCCGGETESPEYLWSGHFPYLKGVACNFCGDSPHFLWNYPIDSEKLRRTLNRARLLDSEVLGIEIAERSESRRVLQLAVRSERGQLEISGKDFRRLLGYDFLRSTKFVVQKKEGGYLFSGLGWGHGVGLCQWGAKGMADKGMDYHSILKYYYRDVEVRNIPRRKTGSTPAKP
jgi:stage II sporulation protein D